LATSIKELPEELVIIPDGVEADLRDGFLTLKGPLGEVRRDLNKIRVESYLESRQVKIRPFSSRKKHVAIMNTTRSIINNMITGVTKGFTYKMKVA
jgi:ribosomal protein L6P/L9E